MKPNLIPSNIIALLSRSAAQVTSSARYQSGFQAFVVSMASLWLATPADATVTFTSNTTILTAPATTDSTTPVDVTGLTTTLTGYTGNALVVAAFSGEKDTNSQSLTATYNLASGGNLFGGSYNRVLTKNDGLDTGAGSAVGIKDVTIADSPFSLQHSNDTTAQPDLRTLTGSTLTAIPLKSDDGLKTLASATGTGAAVASKETGVLVTTTSQLNVAAVHANTDEIFVMASFDVSADNTVSATWNLQYKKDGLADIPANWTDIGNPAERTVDANEGIVTMVGLADLGDSGGSAAYDIRLIQNSDGNANLETHEANIVALSLAIDENEYLQSYKPTAAVSTTGASISLSLDADMQVFAAANITAKSTTNTTGTYSLTDGTTTLSASDREVTSTSLGSAALASVYTTTAAAVDTLTISADSGMTFENTTNFVAFGLTSSFAAVPEPSSISLILLASTLAICRRRRM